MNQNYFWELAKIITPPVAEFDEARRRVFLKTVDEALAHRPEARRQMGVFLGFIRLLCLVRPPEAVLAWLEQNPVGLLRKGFWGLKVLCCMGCYTDPQVLALIGYSPKGLPSLK